MELTGRQRDFLEQLLDLYGKGEQPLHYSAVAEGLGVSPMTAYDMLRLLEKRGLVGSEYVLPKGGGRGRSSVFFSPTRRAMEVMAELAGDAWDREEWSATKAHILGALRDGKGTDYQDLVEEILVHLPQQRSSARYATEIITAILITLHQVAEDPAGTISERLEDLGFPEEAGLQAMAGLAMGLTLAERANKRVTSGLPSCIRGYQDYVARLSSANRRQLADFTLEVSRLIETWARP